MPRWQFAILARKKGAIGLEHEYLAEREGADCDEAALKLYGEYEHISIEHIQLLPDKPKEKTP